MSHVTPSSHKSMVLFWEAVADRELAKTAILLEKKQSRLKWLQNLPFEEQAEANYKQIKVLENELSVFLGLLGTMENLRNEYVATTAAVADRLIKLTVQRDYFKSELLNMMQQGGAYSI